jgi:hypothetical protein
VTQAEADEALAQAIRDHADAYEMRRPGDLLGDYAVIANWQPDVDVDDSRYTIAYHRAHVPDHVARGLFATALAHLDSRDDD